MTVRWSVALAVRCVTLVAMLLFFVSADCAGLSPSQQRGLTWLNSQVQANGSLTSEGESIAIPLQTREESILTLHALGTVPSALAGSVASDAPPNVEFLARRILANVASGHGTEGDIADVLAAQREDGGWGLNEGYRSDALDTALVLQALAAANAQSAGVSDALSFLKSSANADGGWGVGGSSLYVTSNVLLAATEWSGQANPSSELTSSASNWLLAARNDSQEFGDAFLNAIALLALASDANSSSALAPLMTALANSQLADGSWAEDPYTTALALRAAWVAQQVPILPTSGDVIGTVIDQSSNQTLQGVSVSLIENAGFQATTGADGKFQLVGIPAGNYTLRVTRAGYQSRSDGIVVTAGKTLSLGSIPLLAISTTATLTGVVKDNSGQVLQNVIITAGSKSTLSDGEGAYQLVGIPAGAATVTAGLAGFRTVSTTVTFLAGTSYLFSPTMYPTSTAPPPTSLYGVVLDANTSQPIAGASVLVNAVSQLTDESGKFTYATIATGSYGLTVSAPGYQSVYGTVTVVAGANDLGTILLKPAASTTTLHGHVLDAVGNPISGAKISIASGASATSDDVGAYTLSGITDLQFTMDISATGFIDQAFLLSVNAPGDYEQDFQLVAQQVTNVTLGPLTVVPTTAGAGTNLSVSSTLVNGGDAPFDGVLLLEVYDAEDVRIGSGPLTDIGGFSIGAVTLQPGDSLGILGRWNTGQFAPGLYKFELRLVETNSVTRVVPLGTLIQSQFASFEIVPTAHFTGTVAGDPPVVQAGLNQSIHLTGVVQNSGNVPFEGQAMTLIVTEAKTGAVAFTASSSIETLQTNALAMLDFGSWTPQSGGNYSLTITTADHSLGSISGSVYVGNVAQAAFSVNPDAVLAGTRITHGNIHLTGVDPAQATITDPLAPLIRAAIQKAVTYNDTTARTWVDTNRCTSCHISNQALIGGELTRELSTFNALDRSVIVNNVATNQAPNGSMTAGDTAIAPKRFGSMILWGLHGYHDKEELQSVFKHAADWVVGIQQSNGEWVQDWKSSPPRAVTWFDNDISMSMLNLSSLRRTTELLKAKTTIPTYSAQTRIAAAPISSRGFLTATPDGDLYYTDRSGPSVALIHPDGSLVRKWTKVGATNISDPRSVVIRQDGQVWLSSSSGTLRLNEDGSTTKLSTDSMDSLAIDASGTVWGIKVGDPRSIYQLDPVTAKAVPWISNGPFQQSQLGRLTPGDDGSLYVTDLSKGKIFQVMPDKSVSTVTEIIQGTQSIPALLHLLKDGDHWLLSTSNGIVRLSADWTGHTIIWGRADQMARLSDGSIVYVTNQTAGVKDLVPLAEPIGNALTKYATAIDKGTSWLQAQTIASSDKMFTLHTAQKLWGLGEAYRYFKPIDATRAASIRSAMTTLAAQLRSNQAADGGFGVTKTSASDALVTAQVGIALDYLDPSASDPAIRKAVAWLLSQQQAGGAWHSADKVMDTDVSTTTMVAIWLPMILDRLGAIDAQVTAKFPPNVQPSSFDPAPTHTATDGTGNITANWSLVGVTNDGVDLGFDLTLLDMQPGETRPVATDAHMTFNNSFNQQTVTQPIDIPDVVATARVSLSVATDHPDYPANATALVTTTLVNLDDVEIDGELLVNVYDRHGVLVGTVTQRAVSIPPAGNLPVTDTFPIGTILPARYAVKAVLADRAGAPLAVGETAFNVLPDDVSASATSTVHTDKQVYNPTDQVQILSRVESVAANTVLENISLHVNVYDSSNALKYTHTYPIAQLLPGQNLDFTGVEALTNAAPGLYAVKQDLFDSDGNLFNHVEAAYSVSSTSDTGFGLVGTIAAEPKSLPVGGMLTLNGTATNQGNSALNDLPLTITIIDPDDASILQQFDQTSAIGIGGTVPFTPAWKTRGTIDKTYYALLSATIGTGASARSVTLAVDSFELTIKLDAEVTITPKRPPLAALVLVDTDATPAELAQVDAALATMDYAVTFASTREDFASGVRSGAYQLYLLLATNVTPDAKTWRLLREAVHRGDGLLTANGVAELPQVLAQVSGVSDSAALPRIDGQAIEVLASAPGGTAHIGLSPSLSSRIVVPTIAQTQAVLTGRLPATPDQGSLTNELATTGRIDIGYFGADSGTKGSQLSLASLGRIRKADGSDASTVWRIRNSGDTVRNIVLSSSAGGYAPALTIASHSDAYIASPIIAGTAEHSLIEAGQSIQTIAAVTAVFNDTRLVDVGDNPGAIALWANQIGMLGVLDWTGSQHVVRGAVHSNSDIRLAGAQNLVDGPVHYVTTFTNSGSQNTFTYQPRPVNAQPMPTLLDLDDFKPGGPVASALGTQYIDASAECASSHHGWQRNASQMPIASGLYWIPCDVHINGGNGTTSNVTLVSTGAMQIDGVKGTFQPFYQGIQFATSSASAAALQLSGDATRIGGLVFAPNGTVQVSGSSLVLQCSVIGNQIRFANAKTTIDTRQCAHATIQRKSPAVLLNAFGEGWAGYAVFDWAGAIVGYDSATSGELAALFGGVLAEVAPLQNDLRSGTIVPFKLDVRNLNDAFTGQLKVQASDDSTLVPPIATWALDFTQQSTFTTQSNVRLGSGTSTDLAASISAATPIVLDPVAQSTASIAHLPGEAIGDLVAAFAAVAGSDAELGNALADVQAAQAALSAGDREGAIDYLLDAAEACGNSANGEADALRTRVDWLIWANTH